MAFTHKLPDAARRHLQAADLLDSGHRRDVAGYLYGIAAECAIKEMMVPLSLPAEHDKNEIFHAHFPELRTMLRDALKGRRVKPLMTFILDDRFMNNWNVKMRYADSTQIREEWVNSWRDQARAAVGAMGT